MKEDARTCKDRIHFNGAISEEKITPQIDQKISLARSGRIRDKYLLLI